jgi:hypothetical protein
VEIKDGTITTIRPFDTPISNDHTRFDLTILAVAASSPIPSILNKIFLVMKKSTCLQRVRLIEEPFSLVKEITIEIFSSQFSFWT